MRTTNNAAPKLRPVLDLEPPRPPRVTSAVAGFIVCAFAGAISGYAAGILTGFLVWHR